MKIFKRLSACVIALSFAVLTIVLPVWAATLDQSHTTQNSYYGVGISAAYTKVSQSFTPSASGTCAQVDLYFYKINSPTDNIQVQIYSDDGSGKPNAALSDVVSLDSSTITASWAWYSFVFSSPASISSGTLYHIVVSRSGSVDAGNYIQWGHDTAAGYASGQAGRNEGATWYAISTRDMDFKQYYDEVAGWSAFSSVMGSDPTTFSTIMSADPTTISTFMGVATGI